MPVPSSLPALLKDVESIDLKSSADEVLAVREAMGYISARLREIRKEFDGRIIEWMKKHGDIEITPSIKLYLGTTRTHKPYKLAEAVEALVQAVDGDWERFVAALSINAIRPGAAKKLLGESFSDHFETREGDKLIVKTHDASFGALTHED